MNFKNLAGAIGDVLMQLCIPVVVVSIVLLIFDQYVQYSIPETVTESEKLCFKVRELVEAEISNLCPTDPSDWKLFLRGHTFGPDRDVWTGEQQSALGCLEKADSGCFLPRIEELKEVRRQYEGELGSWYVSTVLNLQRNWSDFFWLVVLAAFPLSLFNFPFFTKSGEEKVGRKIKVVFYRFSIMVPIWLYVSYRIYHREDLLDLIHLETMSPSVQTFYQGFYWWGLAVSFLPIVQQVVGYGLGEINGLVTPNWHWTLKWFPGAPLRLARSAITVPLIWAVIVPLTLRQSLVEGVPVYNLLVILLAGNVTGSNLMATLPSLWPLINFATVFSGSLAEAFDHVSQNTLTKSD